MDQTFGGLKAVGSKSILEGGGGRSIMNLNKSELFLHISSSLVCFAYTNGNLGEGGGLASPRPPLPTTLSLCSAM
jgi:hypothetical protein